MSAAAVNQHRSALLMLKLMAQGDADVMSGKTVPQERVFQELGSRVTAAE